MSGNIPKPFRSLAFGGFFYAKLVWSSYETPIHPLNK